MLHLICSTQSKRALKSLLMGTVIALSACSHSKPKPDGDSSAHSGSISQENISNGAVSSDAGNAYGLQTVHFAFDSRTLDDQAKSELKTNAKILNQNQVLHVQVEGHCDSRGGIQYNIALGEKRAVTVKHFLQDQGVRSDRITVISYGKERPIDTAETEAAYAKNRRANFVVTQGMM